MPPKRKLTKEGIEEAALEIVRREGEGALNARAIAHELDSSTQPIFSNFSSMEELRRAVTRRAYGVYQNFAESVLASGEYPPYKSFGMAYARFAKDEPRLFSLLFMTRRAQDATAFDDPITADTVIPILMKQMDFDRETATAFHFDIWTFIHGIAVMLATSFYSIPDEQISDMLTHAYIGIGNYFKENKK